MASQRISCDFKNLPDSPGVYFFKDAKGAVLYIGKAASLKSRVRSYFREDLLLTRGPKLVSMLGRARRVDFKKTDSVLEALFFEAELIRKYQPKYNTDLKDDKSNSLVVITKEKFPRVLIVRKRELNTENGKLPVTSRQYGSFPHGMQLREAMKIIRRIFPYRDRCAPEQGRPCFNAQIGLCPGMCAGRVLREEYAKTIRNIRLFFEGKKKALLSHLKRDMREYAKNLEFEKADETKRKIFALTHIQDVALMKHSAPALPLEEERGLRIEAYDIAHISGTNVVGVMVVIEDGEARKSEYRKFAIKSFAGAHDIRALREILARRLAHPEWPYPKLIAVDGGKAQVNAAEKVLAESGVLIPVIGVVKDERHQPREILGNARLRREHERDIVLANSEAHRFAVKYHREKRGEL